MPPYFVAAFLILLVSVGVFFMKLVSFTKALSVCGACVRNSPPSRQHALSAERVRESNLIPGNALPGN